MAKPSHHDLTKVLSEAGPLHHEFEQVALKGKRDEQWAAFYAAYALGRLGDFVAPSTLSKWLEEVRTAENWAAAASDYLLTQLT